MSDTPRTDAVWLSEHFTYEKLIDLCEKLEVENRKIERELNAMTEERDELKEEVRSLKETILDQESHILELQSRRPFTPGYTADP